MGILLRGGHKKHPAIYPNADARGYIDHWVYLRTVGGSNFMELTQRDHRRFLDRNNAAEQKYTSATAALSIDCKN